MSDEDVLITLSNVHKTYLLGSDGVPALRGVSLAVRRGEFVAVYGASGSGKSTLLSTIGTIDRHSKGDLTLFGVKVNERTVSDAELAALRLDSIGFVFQAFNLLPTLTAIQNVELPMVLAGKLSSAERRRRAKYLLDRVGMAHRERNLPAQLSGGEQQRVTIARALANKPSLLLLDEPTGDLDTLNTDIIMSFLLDLYQEMDMTFVMVTHDVALRHYADRVVQMRDGKVVDIAEVPQETKTNARQVLKEQVATGVSKPPPYREGSGGAGETHAIPSSTTIRQPSDYRAAAYSRSA